MRKEIVSTVMLLALAAPAVAQTQDAHVSAYAGEEGREIKSLSADDIAELRRGGGWGLARAAELNGVPGPAHLLELKDEIPLTPEQIADITVIFEAMKAQAIAKGEELIAAEQAMETSFREGSITREMLERQVRGIADIRADLRIIHLSTHLLTPELLSTDQIARYNVLRGYGADPCANVPEGHDPAMWRKHNGCE